MTKIMITSSGPGFFEWFPALEYGLLKKEIEINIHTLLNMLLEKNQSYPDGDRVVSLKRRKKFVSTQDLGLIQRTKTT